MRYPRIDPKLDRRRIFTPEDIQTILELYKDGASIPDIKRAYDTHYSTIKYIVNPEYKKERQEQANRDNKRKRATSPKWVKRHRELSKASHQYKRSVTPEEKTYDKLQLIKWKKETNYKSTNQ